MGGKVGAGGHGITLTVLNGKRMTEASHRKAAALSGVFHQAQPAGLPGGTGSHREECGDIDIRIDRNGCWFYHGSPIGRKEMVCLFASVLERRDDGSFWLVTPAEAGRIVVEDAPFLGVEAYFCQAGRDLVVSIRTNVDEMIDLDDDHPLRLVHNSATGEPIPYIQVRDGLEARLTRAVYYELVAMGHEEKINGEAVYGLWSKGTFFPLGSLADLA